MESEKILVNNVKCSGCAATIKEALLQLPGIERVEVNIGPKEVVVEGTRLDKTLIRTILQNIGLPCAHRITNTNEQQGEQKNPPLQRI